MVKKVCSVDLVDSFNRKAQAERDEDEEAITTGTIDHRHEQIEENPIQEDGEDRHVNKQSLDTTIITDDRKRR